MGCRPRPIDIAGPRVTYLHDTNVALDTAFGAEVFSHSVYPPASAGRRHAGVVDVGGSCVVCHY